MITNHVINLTVEETNKYSTENISAKVFIRKSIKEEIMKFLDIVI